MRVGLLGFGTVGSGVRALLLQERLQKQEISLAMIFSRRKAEECEAIWANTFSEVVESPEVDVIVEVMGGMEPAYTQVKTALLNGKHVVSANKFMLSHHLPELLAIARENGVSLAYSAAVGGGIPWLVNLVRLLRVDDVSYVGGILNGTSNFILSEMREKGKAFKEVLQEAQALGYAEADPSADIDGLDVRAKIAISAGLAGGCFISPEEIPVMGIRRITKEDIAFFESRGLVCKLMGHAFLGKEESVFVEPTLLEKKDVIAHIGGAENIISLCGESIGAQSFVGAGAGKVPTAAAVVQDILDIKAGRSLFDMANFDGVAHCSQESEKHEYYVRTTAPLREAHIKEKVSETGYLTRALTVGAAHVLYEELLLQDETSFLAGIKGSENE